MSANDTRPEAASRVSSQPPRNDGSALGTDRQDARAFRKRPVVVEAVRFAEDGSNWIACCRFLGDEDSYDASDATPEFLDVPTLHGQTECLPGDWIIRGPSGDYWPCKADIFAESYESLADFDAVESACKSCAGLSADVTRLEAAWIADVKRLGGLLGAAEVRVKELEETVSALTGALAAFPLSESLDACIEIVTRLDDGDEAYYASSQQVLDVSTLLAHLRVMRDDKAIAGEALADLAQSVSPLPPVPVGPDGEAADELANSAKGAEVRGKADA